MEIHLTNFSLLAVDVGRVLLGCGILCLHEVKRPDPARGCVNVHQKSLKVSYVVGFIFFKSVREYSKKHYHA